MDAAITPMMQKHYPVLLKEIISIISPQYGGTFIDCTFGQGGYSNKILEFDKTKVIGLDRDPQTESVAYKLEEKFEDRFKFKNIKFSQLKNLKLKFTDDLGNVTITNSSKKNKYFTEYAKFMMDKMMINNSNNDKFNILKLRLERNPRIVKIVSFNKAEFKFRIRYYIIFLSTPGEFKTTKLWKTYGLFTPLSSSVLYWIQTYLCL